MKLWDISLHQRPTVVAAGVVEHGRWRPTERWWLPTTWTLHAYSYEAELRLDDEPFSIRPCSVGTIPPAVHQDYRFTGPSRHVFAHLELPDGGPLVQIPALLDLGERFTGFSARFEEAVGDFATQPMRCNVRVWDLLWELARSAETARGTADDPRLTETMALIERALDQTLSVSDLADQAGLSHNQLTRLFRARFGSTVVGYIRKRRVERAVHLLSHTDMPARLIGAQVGIPDPQAFNKTVRAVSGKPPSAYRR